MKNSLWVFVFLRPRYSLRFPRLRLFIFFFSEALLKNVPVERATLLRRSMRKTTSCKKTWESPGCSSSLIGQKNIFSGQSEGGISNASGTCFGKSKCPGALPLLLWTFAHENPVVPTSCPWVSEDAISVIAEKKNAQQSLQSYRNHSSAIVVKWCDRYDRWSVVP